METSSAEPESEESRWYLNRNMLTGTTTYSSLPTDLTDHDDSKLESPRAPSPGLTEYDSPNEDTHPLTTENRKSRLSGCQILVINLPWFGLSLMYLILTIEVIPAQVETMVGQQVKGTVLGLMVAFGAILTLIFSPLLGLTSDRLNTRWGQRKPIILFSTFMLCLGLVGMAFSTPNITVYSKNSTTLQCGLNLTEKRCSPYNWYPEDFELNSNSVSQSSAVSVPLFSFIAEGKFSGYIGAYLGCYLFLVVAYAGISVPYNALIADLTHASQRGINSGVMGGMILFGNICGACLGLFISNLGLHAVYAIICGIVFICIGIMLVTVKETTAPQTQLNDSISCNKYCKIFCEPFQERNFRWLFFTRFLMQQGISTIFTFIQYWVSDMVQVPGCWSKEKAVAVLLIPLVIAAAICSVVFGILSDRLQKRKPLVIISSVLMSVSAASFSLIRGGEYSYFYALGLVFLSGIGYGTYLSVDFALLLDVLPSCSDKAKDIAIWNQALILPQVLATPFGGFILDFFEQMNCVLGLGYIILFSMTAIYFFISGIFVIKIDVS